MNPLLWRPGSKMSAIYKLFAPAPKGTSPFEWLLMNGLQRSESHFREIKFLSEVKFSKRFLRYIPADNIINTIRVIKFIRKMGFIHCLDTQ